jgi:quercetin dioxygenase-like cupin family protein
MSRFSATALGAWGIGLLIWTCVAPSAEAPAAGGAQGALNPFRSVQFAQDDDVKCLADALEAGDPARGPSTILLKATPGCVVAWHYHTAMEQVTVIRGFLEMEMTGHAAATLGPGGFAAMPGKMAHRFVCTGKKECLLSVMFDGAYDIFWGKDN